MSATTRRRFRIRVSPGAAYTSLVIAGGALLTAGIAMVFVPAALVVAGLALGGLGMVGLGSKGVRR